MKKYINKFSFVLLFICISLFLGFPSKIKALDINSDYYEYNKTSHLIKLKNVDASLNFFVGSQNYNGSERVYISGSFSNPNYLNDTIYTKTLFFDSNKEVIAICDSEDSLLGKGYSAVAFYCGVDESNFISNKSIDDIMYYKILISANIPISNEDENHYNDNQNVYIEDSNENLIDNNQNIYNEDSKEDLTNNNSTIYNSNSEYTLNNYDINIIVNENNTLNITEKIGAYFNVEKHGIFRKIPLRNEVTRLDGTTSKNRAKISDIKVSDNYSLSTESGYKVIKIGDANYTLTGQKNYEISYLYNLGRDTGKEYDELYFNLIGDEWDTSISNITFTITMPKEFDSSKLGFSSGVIGSTDSSKITYNVDGNIISGKYNGTLGSGEALTVRLELPEGYFVGASFNIDLLSILAIVLPLLFVFITYLLWNKFGKDEQVVETVEFYPPQGFNSAEVGFLYKGKVENKDVISLLIYLANRGYIKIVETEEKSLFSTSKGFKIVKQREYDGNNPNEALFLKGLFSSKSSSISFSNMIDYMKNPQSVSETYSTGAITEVTAMDLYDNFYITLGRIITNINNKKNKEKIFEKSSLGKGALVIVMIIATFLLITIKPVIESDGGIAMLPFAIIFPGIGFSVLFGMLFGKTPIPVKIFGLIWGLGFGGMPWAFMVLPSLLAEPIYLIAYIIGLGCILTMILLFKAMPKRTKYGNEMLGKIKGFKNFLETAEKQKLEAMVMENPTYFYDILPFTYVLGVSDKWIKKFETISLQAPNWYDGYSSFNTASFGSFINSTMSSATSAMSSSPSSSSSGGGGSSGGGSSGGGSGGGGGGSW